MKKPFTAKELANAVVRCDRIIALLSYIPVGDETVNELDVAFKMVRAAKRKFEKRLLVEYVRRKTSDYHR